MNEELRPLPLDIKDAIGLVIRLKPNASHASRENFGQYDLYYFDLKVMNFPLTDDQRIRLHPIAESTSIIDMSKVHILATMMGYAALREKFYVVYSTHDRVVIDPPTH